MLFLFAILAGASAGAAQFDRTIPASRGMHLDVRLFGGEIVVRAWDRNDVRVRAIHFKTDVIDVRTDGSAIAVRARARTGKPHAIDFEIDVPAWMAVSVAGTYLDIVVKGTAANVTARTVRGDVRVTGGAGEVSLASVEGQVVLEGARARARLESVNNGIRVTGLQGELIAETVSGGVKMQSVSTTSATVGTVSGDISWDGPLTPGGSYQFATHDGDVDLNLLDPADATIVIRSFDGHVHSMLPVKLPEPTAGGKRFNLTLGSGAAKVELETFTGTVSLRQK